MPFVLCTSFLIMNVVVGIVVNAISKVSESQAAQADEEGEQSEGEESEDTHIQLRKELSNLRKQLAHVEELLDRQEIEKNE